MSGVAAARASRRRRLAGIGACLVVASLLGAQPARSQTPPSFAGCIAEALNQGAPVQLDGRYTINNVPADTGEYFRTLVTCPRAPGVVVRGESALAQMANGQTLDLPPLEFKTRIAVQGTLVLVSSTDTLGRPGDRAVLTAIGQFPGGVQRNLTYPRTGTTYRTSNGSVAGVSATGEVVARGPGVVVVSALNGGRTASTRIRVRGTAGVDGDGDGMTDACETANGLDPLSPYDADLDPDLDGLTNRAECEVGTRVDDPDTDDDGLDDAAEGVVGTDPTNADTDDDRLGDAEELMRGTDPLDPNSDGGCLLDGDEVRVGLNPLNGADDATDSDGDGLTNCDEVAFGADPSNPDSDEDGIRDGEEVMAGTDGFITDPTDADSDDDGLNDGAEVELGTDPTNPATVASSVVIDNRTVTLRGRVLLGSLTLRNGAVLTLPASTATIVPRLELVVDSLTIDASSRIDVTGRGFVGALTPGNATSQGRTLGNQPGSQRRSGGSHGGLGGLGDFDRVTNPTYGDVRDPNHPGSGGGGDCTPGGNGGGVLRITAGALSLAGQIVADGQDGQGTCGAGGSGGSIKLTVGTIAGTGTIRANGGPGDDQVDNAGGGGGGRIALIYTTSSGFPLSNLEAIGGDGIGRGGVGTIFLRQVGVQTLGEVVLDGRGIVPSRATPFYSLQGRPSTDLTATVLTDAGAAFVPGTLVGIELNPNTTQAQTFTVVANDETTITVDAADGDMTSVAAGGDGYAAEHGFERLTLAQNAAAEVLDGDGSRADRRGRFAAGNLVLATNARLGHPPSSTSATFGLDLAVPGTLTVATTAAIDVTGRGFPGAFMGGNNSASGRTLGNVPGSARRSGGSYGGLGGLGNFDMVNNAVYGDFRNPDEPGSGGGGDCTPGGSGGGLVRIAAGTVTVDGAIVADGGPGIANCGAGGSGGGIRIATGTLAGGGQIRANGGPDDIDHNAGGGGGGGRIAIAYATVAGFDLANVQAIGGDGAGRGGVGTIFLRDTDTQTLGELRLDGQDLTPTRVTPLYALQGQPSTALTATTLTDTTASFLPGTLVGLELNPNTAQGTTFRVIANTATMLMTDPADGDMTAVAAVGNPYGGEPVLDRLTITARAQAEVTDGDQTRPDQRGLLTATVLDVTAQGLLTHPGATPTARYGLELAVPGTLTVDATGAVDASAKGFLGALTGGNNVGSGRTLGNVAGSARRSGGSYGGLGGLGNFDRSANAQYGDFRVPDDPGSGGGGDCTPGGNGGGLIHVDAGTVVVDGLVAADGGAGIANCGAGGSGGGIKIVTGNLGGSGTVRANGGPDDIDHDAGGGGGGGRVAVLYDTLAGFDLTHLHVLGGTGNGTGGTGTVFTKRTGDRGVLVVRGAGRETPLPEPFAGDDILLDGALVSAQTSNPVVLQLVNSSVLTHPGATTASEPRLAITAGTIDVDATSRIDVTARGFLGALMGGNNVGSGRTLGNVSGSGRRSGGSYGGLGGLGNFDMVTNGLYGDFRDPDELGSGGGGDCTPGGNGGGLVRITATTLDVDGAIVADGGAGLDNCGAGGSGGGIKVAAGTLRGAGLMRANGGPDDIDHDAGGGGGGGRIAVFYDTLDGFDLADLAVLGGTGRGEGGSGTVYTKRAGFAGQLVVRGAGRETPLPTSDGADDITLDGALVSATSLEALTLRLVNGTVLTHPGATTSTDSRLTITTGTLQIDATSAIDVTGRGFLGALTGGNNIGSGRTLGNVAGSGRRSGGSYGGLGGLGDFDRATNPVYGDFRNPDEPGSGGGGDCTPGGSGGGLVRIAAGTVTVDGAIVADGGPGIANCGAGGSGGGIRIATGTLAGGGQIRANGGPDDIDHNAGGGGGGGRIAIAYATVAGFDLANVQAIGGDGAGRGGVGTIFLRDTDTQTLGELRLDGQDLTPTRVTPLYALQGQPSTGLTATTLTDTTASFVPGTLVGLELNPNTAQGTTFRVIANTATMLMTDPADGDMTAVATVGTPYGGEPVLDRLTITARAQAEVADGDQARADQRGLLTATVLDVTAQGLLTHPVATTTARFGLELAVPGTLTVDATSAVDASAKGFLGAFMGGNNSSSGRTLGNLLGSARRSGGSYGGLGGLGNFDMSPNVVYGDFRDPDEPGSGGGGDCSPSGTGGGLIRVEAGTVVVDGLVAADGGLGITPCGAGGSGGGIKIVTGSLGGSGTVRANGGSDDADLSNGGGGGGGGGRVAVVYDALAGFSLANLQAAGALADGSGNGGAGTIFTIEADAQTFGDLVVDNLSRVVPNGSTPLRAIGSTTSTALAANVLTNTGAAFPVPDELTGALGLLGLELRPNVAMTQTFTVVDNTGTMLLTDPADGDMTAVATNGDTYVGVYVLDAITVRNGGRVATADRTEAPSVSVDGASRLQSANLNLP